MRIHGSNIWGPCLFFNDFLHKLYQLSHSDQSLIKKGRNFLPRYIFLMEYMVNPYIKLPKTQIIKGRQNEVIARCKNKSVLHLGCVDIGPHFHERATKGDLLHQKLSTVASDLWGVDIDKNGISYLQQEGYNNLILGDICQLDQIEKLQNKKFDVILATEVVEHLQNPGAFLTNVKSIMIPKKTDLIITVPNAFQVNSFIWLFRGFEFVHPDHNYWFSYHTITNLVKQNGLKVENILVYSFRSPGIKFARKTYNGIFSYVRSLPKQILVTYLLSRSAFWGDGIFLIAKLPNATK